MRNFPFLKKKKDASKKSSSKSAKESKAPAVSSSVIVADGLGILSVRVENDPRLSIRLVSRRFIPFLDACLYSPFLLFSIDSFID